MSDMEPCSFGDALGKQCHSVYFPRTAGLKLCSSTEVHDLKVMQWRAGLSHNRNSKICFSHEAKVPRRYRPKSKNCCNIFKIHKRSSNGITEVSLILVEKLEVKGFSVEPGDKLCKRCHERATQTIAVGTSPVEDSDMELGPNPAGSFDTLNDTSPVNLHDVHVKK